MRRRRGESLAAAAAAKGDPMLMEMDGWARERGGIKHKRGRERGWTPPPPCHPPQLRDMRSLRRHKKRRRKQGRVNGVSEEAEEAEGGGNRVRIKSQQLREKEERALATDGDGGRTTTPPSLAPSLRCARRRAERALSPSLSVRGGRERGDFPGRAAAPSLSPSLARSSVCLREPAAPDRVSPSSIVVGRISVGVAEGCKVYNLFAHQE